MIRRYRSEDHADVVALHERALRDAGAFVENAPDLDLDDITGTYIDVGGEFLVNEIDGRIIAMGALRPVTPDTAELKRLRVEPRWQGHGHGASMLAALEQRARHLGFASIKLDTSTRQSAALGLFRSAGYAETHRVEAHDLVFVFMSKALMGASVTDH